MHYMHQCVHGWVHIFIFCKCIWPFVRFWAFCIFMCVWMCEYSCLCLSILGHMWFDCMCVLLFVYDFRKKPSFLCIRGAFSFMHLSCMCGWAYVCWMCLGTCVCIAVHMWACLCTCVHNCVYVYEQVYVLICKLCFCMTVHVYIYVH